MDYESHPSYLADLSCSPPPLPSGVSEPSSGSFDDLSSNIPTNPTITAEPPSHPLPHYWNPQGFLNGTLTGVASGASLVEVAEDTAEQPTSSLAAPLSPDEVPLSTDGLSTNSQMNSSST